MLYANLKFRGLLIIGLTTCWITTSSESDLTLASDPALVRHYTFDQDSGQTAEDRSSCNHHGKLAETQHLEEIKGHRGVLRLNNEKAVLHCPNSDSLFLEGDLSFEMWVRLNGSFEPSSGMLFATTIPSRLPCITGTRSISFIRDSTMNWMHTTTC